MLELGIGPLGTADMRVQRFNDSTLGNSDYRKQGRGWSANQPLTLGKPVLFTTSLYVPSDWASNVPDTNTGVCSMDGTITTCARVIDFSVELGLEVQGKTQ